MPDRTMHVCRSPDNDLVWLECIAPEDLQAIDRILVFTLGDRGPILFRDRNRDSLPIRRAFDAQFTLTSDSDVQPGRKEFYSRFDGADGVILFSTPIYPSEREAAVYVLQVVRAAALVHLVEDDTSWHVTAVHGIR